MSERSLSSTCKVTTTKGWRYKPNKPLKENVQRLARAQTQSILAKLDQARTPGPDLDEFIHDVRLAGKHLNALLCLVPRNQQRKKLRRKIKRMTQRLSAARDAFIRTQVLTRADLSQISKQLPRAAERAYRQSTKRLIDEHWTQCLRNDLAQIAEGFSALDAGSDQPGIEYHIARCYGAAKKVTPHPETLADLNLEQWHLWRRKCKTLLVLLLLIEGSFNKVLRDLAQGLRSLTHDLGELQDLDVTIRYAKPKHRQSLFSAMAVEMAELAMTCQAQGQALLQMSEAEFKQQLQEAIRKKLR
ncbi:MAG: CHAD domain-containing protein [Pseudomonadales bacterium]